MIRCCIILFILIKSTALFAQQQKQNSNWHFGINCSIDFTRGYPIVKNSSQIISSEACAAISDSIGKLLFYTNGDTVWRADHTIMPNGTGLMGSGDVQQGVLIVPKPKSPYTYYIFTISSPERELRYSIVDMALNDSTGDVIEKNTLVDKNVTEKLTATRNNNGIDFWVVEKDFSTNQFKSYAVTENGIASTPVVSAVGVPIQNDDYSGAIKISQNGCWMISTTRGLNNNPGIVEFFHFDNSSGGVSDGAGTTAIRHPYGLEFSPDDTKFYIGENDRKPVYQFNINAGNENQVIASVLPVSDTFTATYAFQLAPDGRIYFVTADTGSLGAILSPNSYYIACNVRDSIIVGLNKSTIGLPNNFNLPNKGYLSCGLRIQGCEVDLNKLMPKAFTPNGDGLNDCYGIKFKDPLPFLDFAIYNRWGNRVFYTDNENDCWDGYYQGRKADAGNYVYYFRLKVDCGYTIKTGYVVLIR